MGPQTSHPHLTVVITHKWYECLIIDQLPPSSSTKPRVPEFHGHVKKSLLKRCAAMNLSKHGWTTNKQTFAIIEYRLPYKSQIIWMSDYRLVAPGSPMSHCVIVTVSRSVTFSHVTARQLFLSPQSRDPVIILSCTQHIIANFDE